MEIGGLFGVPATHLVRKNPPIRIGASLGPPADYESAPLLADGYNGCLVMLIRISTLLFLTALGMHAAEPAPKEIIMIDAHVAIPMRDGVKLFGDVYRPKREGKFPAIIIRTPYGVQRDGSHQAPTMFARQGYVAMMVDVRGRFESEGNWDPFRDEGNDGYDIIEWAAVQRWSNGRVGTSGGSYLGHNQWRAASAAPPHLVASFPAVASTSIYKNWAFYGGAFRLSFNYGWGVVRMPFRIMQPQYWHTESYSPPELSYDRILWSLPLKTADVASGKAVKHWRDWVEHQSFDSYWKAFDDEERFEKIQAPMHTLGGYFDIFLAGSINGYVGMRNRGGNEKARRGSRMILGPWGHGPSQKFGDIDFGVAAMVDQRSMELRWFDYHLKGEQNGLDKEPPVDFFFMGINKWRKAENWPVPGTRYTPVYLASGGAANTGRGDGSLSFTQPAGAESDTYTYDPANPVTTLGGNNCCGTPTIAGPKDQRPLESRNDLLVYTSDFLKQPLAIAGPVKMKLHAATDGRDTDWMVKLIDVQPNGYAMNIAEGILRARFRKGVDQMELLEPNRVYEFEVDMAGTANVFLPGHRIRVDITSSNFPQFDRNPNTGADLGADAKLRVAKQIVYHSGQRPSAIILPVVNVP